jgi:hypothetical protein
VLSKAFARMVLATQMRAICARLGCIQGVSIVADGEGCIPITVSARRVRGPHSLECGWYVML